MNQPQHLTVTEADLYNLITIDDGKANAVSQELADELMAALAAAAADGKAVIITGRADKFSAGFHLKQLADPRLAGNLLKTGGLLLKSIYTHPRPVVSACNGHALALGALMLLASDYRIGTTGPFSIGLNEVAIGMTMPDKAALLGRARIQRSMHHRAIVLGEIFDTESATAAGFLDEAIGADALRARAVAKVEQLAALDATAFRETKAKVWLRELDDFSGAL
ncbi:MAG: crotonase/enoyl-CoA hydratase family protein [Ilumatobacteraceae bacterium]